jgi:hypothetical protein
MAAVLMCRMRGQTLTPLDIPKAGAQWPDTQKRSALY